VGERGLVEVIYCKADLNYLDPTEVHPGQTFDSYTRSERYHFFGWKTVCSCDTQVVYKICVLPVIRAGECNCVLSVLRNYIDFIWMAQPWPRLHKPVTYLNLKYAILFFWIEYPHRHTPVPTRHRCRLRNGDV
jgi:hypothetical protein